MTIKICYVNTWYGFDKDDFFFTRIIKEIHDNCHFECGYNSKKYDLILSIRPYSTNCLYHTDMTKIDGKKLCWTGESLDIITATPGCDAYIGFDYEEEMPSNIKYMRMPLYAIYNLDHMNRYNCSSYEELRNKFYTEKVIKKYSAVVSNPSNYFRNNVIKFLVDNNICDSGGRVYPNVQNIGGTQTEKLNFCKNYMYGLAFENLSKKGYITEKIFEVFMSGSVPYYWGAPDIHDEFNPKSYFIFDNTTNISSQNSAQEMINRLNDVELYEEIRKQDPVTGFKAEKYIKNCKEMLKTFIMNIMESK